jgi:hypothetical protein
MAMKNEVNGPLLLTIGAVSAILLVVTAVAVDGWYKSFEADEIAQKWVDSPNTWLQDIRAQQQQNLEDGHQINRSHYRLSIDDAMHLYAAHGGKMPE